MLFDEVLSPKVARALRELGFNTSHVGNVEDGAPPKGTSDRGILAHAKATGQVVVTSNHDMILLCEEQGESVIWIDPRGRQFRVDELALVAFKGIVEWEHILSAATGPVCIRVLRTKVKQLSIEEAGGLALLRVRRIEWRERKKKPNPMGPLEIEN
ncbi:MAG: DUF5615 family PIN-like protein [Actinomycetota bacterium]